MFPATRTLKLCFTRRLNKQVSPPPEARPLHRTSAALCACRGMRRSFFPRLGFYRHAPSRWSRMIINDAE